MVSKTTQTLRKTLSLTFDLSGELHTKQYSNLIMLHLIWQHSSCSLWLILLLFKYIITVLFYGVAFFSMFIKLWFILSQKTRPLKLLHSWWLSKNWTYSSKSQVCLNQFSFTAKNRWHGTLKPRPKTPTKSKHNRLLLHSNPKIAYFSKKY